MPVQRVKSPIPRALRATVEERLRGFPVVTITGPRQSGKTTLARLIRPDAGYFSLEDPDVRGFALEDPRGILRQCGEAAILDEGQQVPSLFLPPGSCGCKATNGPLHPDRIATSKGTKLMFWLRTVQVLSRPSRSNRAKRFTPTPSTGSTMCGSNFRISRSMRGWFMVGIGDSAGIRRRCCHDLTLNLTRLMVRL